MGTDWSISERQYEVVEETDVAIPVDGGDVTLYADVYRPDTDEEVPAIVGASPYNKEYQAAPIEPKSMGPQMGWVESGDPYYFARRGYAHVLLMLRGTGKSDGKFRHIDDREVQDVIDAMDWLAGRDWCDGDMGMFGVSYFGVIQKHVAAKDPERLKAIFAPWSYTDPYRDLYYHGGIMNDFIAAWTGHVDNPRLFDWSKNHYDEAEFRRRIERAKSDPEVYAHEEFVEALENPTEGMNGAIVDPLTNPLDNEYFEEMRVDYEDTNTPAFLGCGWGHYAFHLSGAFRSWKNWQGPKRLLIGPDLYLDRPVYQLQPQAVRWFDHWIKGEDNGVMDEPPIKLFVMNENDWKTAEEWPLPETTFTKFYLHDGGVMFERDYWPEEGSTTYEDGPFRRGSVEFLSPKLVEKTEVVGPVRLNLYASSTDEEALFIAQLYDVDEQGNEEELTRGWLRGSQRKVDESQSTPWHAHHPHDEREPLEPGEVYEFNLNIRPTGTLFEPGHRIGLRIASADSGGWGSFEETDQSWKVSTATGHLKRQSVSRVTIHHNADHPSHLILPVTRGNEMGTYYSGGEPTPTFGEIPERELARDKRAGEHERSRGE